MRLSVLKGLGPRRLALLEQYNIKTSNDLIRFFPLDYVDISKSVFIDEAEPGKKAALRLKIVSGPSFFTRNGMSIITFYGSDGRKKIPICWFNQPFRAKSLAIGDEFIFQGLVTEKNGKRRTLVNPSVYTEIAGIIPIYPSIKGLPGKLIREWIRQVLETEPPMETLSENLREKADLLNFSDAIYAIHFPETMERLKKAWERIHFEKALYFFLYLQDIRCPGALPAGPAFDTSGAEAEFVATFPHTLTNGQRAAMQDIVHDMGSAYRMNRLIEGDVGCGKTAVAEFAIFISFRSGKQSVFMAPTELLARQQYEHLKKRFGGKCGFFSGSLGSGERKNALENIREGIWLVIVGTHALFSEDVHYKDLNLVVTDEQHRFGVGQRASLQKKGNQTDMLVMSATPIPRTLALMLYGDLDVSMIKDMPEGRTPVKTHLVGKNKREKMYRYLAAEAETGHKSYVVCPLIEPAEGKYIPSVESVFEELSGMLPGAKIGFVHGRMGEEEKNAVMGRFKEGDLSILVSTTVIEVGIDVKDAVHIVIEGAEHFGLSALHQLRGRVGRGNIQGHCYLSVTEPKINALERLKVLLDTTDGFEVAEKDMQLRGSGDILGLRQSGESSTVALLAECGAETLLKARRAAVYILEHMTAEYLDLLRCAHEKYHNGDVVMN